MGKSATILLLSTFFWAIGWGIYETFLYAHLYDLGATYFHIVLLGSFGSLAMITSRFWGAISDYFRRRKPFFIIGSLFPSIIILLCVFFSNSGSMLILLYALNMFSWSIGSSPFLTALISENKKYLASYYAVWELGWAIGSTCMGFIYDVYRFYLFLISSFFIAIATLLLVFHPERKEKKKKENFWNYIKVAFTPRFRAFRGFGYLIISIALINCSIGFGWRLLLMRMYDVVGRSKILFGIIWAISVISSICFSLLIGKIIEKKKNINILSTSILLYILMFILGLLTRDPLLFTVILITPASAFFWIGSIYVATQMSYKESTAESIGATQFAESIGGILAFVGGILADIIGREMGIVISVTLLIISLISIEKGYRSWKYFRKTYISNNVSSKNYCRFKH